MTHFRMTDAGDVAYDNPPVSPMSPCGGDQIKAGSHAVERHKPF